MPQKFSSIFNYQKVNTCAQSLFKKPTITISSATINPLNAFYFIEKTIIPGHPAKTVNFYGFCIYFLDIKNKQTTYNPKSINPFFKRISVQLSFDAINICVKKKPSRNSSFNILIFFKYFNFIFKNSNIPMSTMPMFTKLERRSYQRKLEITRVANFITIPNQILFSKIFYNNNFSHFSK